MPRPQQSEFNHFYQRYVDLANGDDVLATLEAATAPLESFLNSIPETKAGHFYAPGKWTIRQMLQHIIDTERIFGYRALCIARGEQQSLPGFEENDYADNAPASNRTLKDLIEELILVRKSIVLLYRNLTEEALLKTGISNQHPLTANALAFITVGHAIHHTIVLKERYL